MKHLQNQVRFVVMELMRNWKIRRVASEGINAYSSFHVLIPTFAESELGFRNISRGLQNLQLFEAAGGRYSMNLNL